jgi:hypothetical protein
MSGPVGLTATGPLLLDDEFLPDKLLPTANPRELAAGLAVQN